MLKFFNRVTLLGFVGVLAAMVYAHFVAGEAVARAVGWTVYVLAGVLTLGASLGLVAWGWSVVERVRAARAARRQAEVEASLRMRKLEAEAARAEAEALRARREAQVYAITAPADHQVFISDAGSGASWRPAHLDARAYANGLPVPPTPLELATWDRWHSVRTGHPATPATEAAPSLQTAWPERVRLLDLLPDAPSLHEITLGITLDEQNRQIPVVAPLQRLVHIGVGGSSGWGKSVFLQAIAFQLAVAPEAVELALIDSELTTFDVFSSAPCLRYPVAAEERDALAIIHDLAGEMRRRRDLFTALSPMPPNLAAYNRRAEEPLPYIVLMIDESTALLEERAIEKSLRQIVLKARKFGLFAVLGGQDWKASTLSTTIRNQFSTRVQFKALDEQQSRVLLRRPDAAYINRPGRGFAVIPGRDVVEIQAPFISSKTILRALEVTRRRKGEKSPRPIPPPPPSRSPE
ncbi:MAG: hypothetical protein D6796_10070, partial [Caldilineae bacterium]